MLKKYFAVGSRNNDSPTWKGPGSHAWVIRPNEAAIAQATMSRFADFPVNLAMLALLGMLAFSAAKQLAPDSGDLHHTSGNVV